MGLFDWLSEKFTEKTGIEVPEEVTEFADEQTGLDESFDDVAGDALDDGSVDAGEIGGLVEDYREEQRPGW